MRAVFVVIHEALDLYKWAIIIVALMSWLISFNVVNIHNNMVRSVWNGLNAITEPALRLIRRFLPNMGGLDLSPIILIFIVWFVQMEMDDLYRAIALGF
jgi:YggT family protein